MLRRQTDESAIFISTKLPADFEFSSITMVTPYLGNPRNLILEYSLDNHTWTPLSDLHRYVELILCKYAWRFKYIITNLSINGI